MKCHPASHIRMAAALLVCTLLGTIACTHHQDLRLKTYVNNAVGLREGAPVRVQGVELGKVTAIRVRPQQGRPPVEIDMLLRPTYELRIPAHAKVHLETEGVLGSTFAEIDVVGTSGPPAADQTVLAAQEQPQPKLDYIVSKIEEAIRKPCKGGADPINSARPESPKARR